MLVLTRQRDETIMIGDDIEVTVVDIRGDKVRLGVTAPREITVHRKEVWEAIRRENRGTVTPNQIHTAEGIISKAWQCGHVNKCPVICNCPPDCYCRIEGSCKVITHVSKV